MSRKWEAVDPEALEKQAVTTSKWDNFEVDSQAEEKKGSVLMNLASYSSEEEDEDVDGQPMESEDVDGKPMESGEEDVDGKPMEEGVGGGEADKKSWMEEVGMTEEEKRKVLREVEVKVVGYLDEVEGGKVARLADMTLAQQAQVHRDKLMEQACQDWHKARANTHTGHPTGKVVAGTARSRSRSRSRSSNSNPVSQRHRSSASAANGASGSDKQKKRRTRSRTRSRSPRNSRNYQHSGGSGGSSSSRKKYRS